MDSAGDQAELNHFAQRYAKAWCSQEPAAVAAFFAEDGSLSVNGGPSAVGRTAIAEVARGFMTAFPDMEVTMNKLIAGPQTTWFHWTLTGTNTGPGGTGKQVRVSGYEKWRLENGLIKRSDGHFDRSEYERQLAHGVSARDNPGVIALPPLLFLGAVLVAAVLQWWSSLTLFGDGLLRWFGLVPVVLGVGIVAWGHHVMTAAGTNVNPFLPATAIVTRGPFRFSRNPLYLGLTLCYGGVIWAIDTWWGFILLPLLCLIVHRGIVLREERYLDRKFGVAYREYCARVRRYL